MKDMAEPETPLGLDELIVCPQCDAAYRLKRPEPGERAVCQRCHKVLITPRKNAGLRIIAVALAVVVLIISAAVFPFLTLDAAGSASDYANVDVPTDAPPARGIAMPAEGTSDELLEVLAQLLRE